MGGYGWGNHTPQCAVDVAEAFYAGRALKRSSCKTNGSSYWFLSKDREVEIARRLVSPEEIADNVERAIAGQAYVKPLEFNIRGWRTPTTARHLNALGLKAECHGTKSSRFTICGHHIPDTLIAQWFTKEDILGWPTEHPEDKAKRLAAAERELARKYRLGRTFVQLTPDMFE